MTFAFAQFRLRRHEDLLALNSNTSVSFKSFSKIADFFTVQKICNTNINVMKAWEGLAMNNVIESHLVHAI